MQGINYFWTNKFYTMKPDLFEAPDYYNLDDLLTDEHKLIRDAAQRMGESVMFLL